MELVTHRKCLLFAITMVMLCVQNTQAAGDLSILSSSKAAPFDALTLKMQQAISPDKSLIVGDKLPENSTSDDLLITLGTAAFRDAVLHTRNVSIYALFITRSAFDAILESNTLAKARRESGTLSALFLEQSYQRQFALIKALTPSAESVGIALGPVSKKDRSMIEQAAKELTLSTDFLTLEGKGNPVKRIQPLIKSNDVFLAVPDRAVLNRTSAKWILELSFRYRVPIIGFSRKYVSSGALAAVLSSPDILVKQAAKIVKSWRIENNFKIPSPSYATEFTVVVNESVAKSLRKKIKSTPELKDEIRKFESQQ